MKPPALRRRTRLLRALRGQDGAQSLIETALILPVFFFMAFGFITFCLVLFSMSNANFASRAALRFASTHSSTSYYPLSQQDLNNVVSPYIFHYPNSTWSVSATYYRNNGATVNNAVGNGLYVTLTISYPFNILGHTYTPIAYSSTGCGLVLQ